MPDLVTIPGVELCETGVDWPASTGPVTFTADDLIAAAQAPYSDPAIKQPRLIFGHLGGNNFEESNGYIRSMPCVGKFTNLRVENEGNLLVGDLTGVPKWLAEILPTAYPSRSIEGFFEVSTNTGKTHQLVVASVALLGEELPGVQTLEDLEYLFSDEPEEWISALTSVKTKVMASQTRAGGDPIPARHVAASVDTSDVRSTFYEEVATEEEGRYWWWLHQVYIDPAVCIAEDDMSPGDFWLVPYSTSASGVTFGDPVEVFMQWVEQESGKVAATAATVSLPERFGHAAQTFASAADSRPTERQVEWDNKDKEKETVAAKATVDMSLVRKLTGKSETELPDDASDEQVNEALAAASAESEGSSKEDDESIEESETEESETEETSSEAEPVAASGVNVSPEAWAEMQADLAARKDKERDDFVSAAVRARKIPPSAKASYLDQLKQGGKIEAATRKAIEGFASNAVPGDPEGTDADTSDATFAKSAGTGLIPELREQKKEG